MALLLGSLRSHFIKHLSCTSPCSTSLARSVVSGFQISFLQSSKEALGGPNRAPRKIISMGRAFSSFSSASETPTAASSTPSYLSVNIRTGKDVAEVLSEALLCFGASSTSVNEDDGRDEHDDEISISSIFPMSQDVHHSIILAASSIGLEEAPEYEVKRGYQSDWIKEIQESFHPVEVTKGLWIVPEWISPPDIHATNVILNPGLAFGTGDHPTTKLCLLLLHGFIKGGELFLDYGTGSGVLAIAAVKLGAALSVGLDIDPQAVASAGHNAFVNDIEPEQLLLQLVPSKTGPLFEDELTTECAEGKNDYDAEIISGKEKYDIVIANILLNPLLELAEEIVSYAKPGAVVGVSGIISEQVPCVVDRYSQLLEGINVSTMDDWACISGTKTRRSC